MRSFLSYLMRLVICVLLFVFYLYGWRPVRMAITQQVIRPRLEHAQAAQFPPPYKIKSDGVALRITFKWNDEEKTIQYRPQAGFFFLISLLTLIFLAADYKWYLMLAGLHLISILLTGGLMIISKNGWVFGFVLVDFIGTYLTPVLSLAIVAWVAAQRKTQKLKAQR